MSFGFDNVKPGSDRQYLRTAGEHENAKFLGLKYDATEEYEYFDIELETADGKYFRERTFGPNKEKLFPRAIYQNNVKVGEETKDQAFERVQQEINTKLFHLACCFCTKDVLAEKVRNVKTLKELVAAVNKVIGEPEGTVNFLTIWKNNKNKQKSNLIIAEKIKWIEKHVEGKRIGISLTKWQIANQLVEEFPYQSKSGNTEDNENTLVEHGQPVGQESDLPF